MSETREFNRYICRVGASLHWEGWKLEMLVKGHLMDPVTAIFAFLATPAGQNVVEDIRKVDATFVTLIAGLVKKTHDAPAPVVKS